MHLSNEFFGILPLYPSALGEKEAFRFCRSSGDGAMQNQSTAPLWISLNSFII